MKSYGEKNIKSSALAAEILTISVFQDLFGNKWSSGITFIAIFVLISWQAVFANTFVTPTDRIPDFSSNPTIESNSSGDWSNPNTWNLSRIPTSNDRVLIHNGNTVNYNVSNPDKIAAITVQGKLSFDSSTETKIFIGTLLVAPDGELEIGTEDNPIIDDFRAWIYFVDSGRQTGSMKDPLTGVDDPEQFASGLIVLGKIRVFGDPRLPTWMRLAKEPKAGDTTIHLLNPVSNWNIEDSLVIPDTRHFSVDHEKRAEENYYRKGSQTEVRLIKRILNSTTIELNGPLEFDHLGAHDPVDPNAADGLVKPELIVGPSTLR